MSRIAVLIGKKFEDVEYTEPAKAFRDAGHELIHVGISKGETVKGKEGLAEVTIDRSVKDVSVDEFDALFIPGGYSPDHLRVDENAVRFTGDFVRSGKQVLAICHAPQLLINAQVLQGRRITGWKSLVQDIKNAGAEYVDREVVEDGNIISSRNPDDIPAFIRASLDRMKTPVAATAQ